MPDKFTIGLVQMSCTAKADENLSRAMDKIREAATRGAQIICLHELFRSEYFCRKEDAALFDLAEAIPGPATEALAKVAKEKKIVLVASLFERRAVGLLTTHDLAIAEIAEALGPQAANFHFEDRFEDEKLIFDYHLTKGIVRTSNALQLMRSIGLDV